mmetsp:Transcript_75597/g.210028  ORF Transcript_75597/g.210028 Transcript_75597/m.210028 type:complete len:355 (-) Transcript_75597:71-1135(-)
MVSTSATSARRSTIVGPWRRMRSPRRPRRHSQILHQRPKNSLEAGPLEGEPSRRPHGGGRAATGRMCAAARPRAFLGARERRRRAVHVAPTAVLGPAGGTSGRHERARAPTPIRGRSTMSRRCVAALPRALLGARESRRRAVHMAPTAFPGPAQGTSGRRERTRGLTQSRGRSTMGGRRRPRRRGGDGANAGGERLSASARSAWTRQPPRASFLVHTVWHAGSARRGSIVVRFAASPSRTSASGFSRRPSSSRPTRSNMPVHTSKEDTPIVAGPAHATANCRARAASRHLAAFYGFTWGSVGSRRTRRSSRCRPRSQTSPGSCSSVRSTTTRLYPLNRHGVHGRSIREVLRQRS